MPEQNRVPKKMNGLPKWLTTVTQFSKILAMILFVILPLLAFYLGVQYQKLVSNAVFNSTINSSVTPIPSMTVLPGGTSGIEGNIVLGPTCPLERPGQNCTKPYMATVIIETYNQSKEVSRFTSDINGNFKVNLSSGAYYLKPISTGYYPRGMPQEVKVSDNSFTNVTINYDTGIR